MSLTVLACRTAAIYNAIDVPIASGNPLTLELVRERIGRAARFQGWDIEDIQPGVVVATKRVGNHAGTSTISFDTSSFDITLRNSTNLQQGPGSIHKLYNRWVKALELSIRQEVASPH
jgi:hypothetical protein